MTEIEKRIDRKRTLFEYAGPDRVVHFSEYLEITKANEVKLRKHMSGFRFFDEKLDGIVAGEVTVVSGKTGEGKTLFAESWIRQMLIVDVDLRACIFSFEVSPATLLAKHEGSPSTPFYLPLELKAMDPVWLADRMEEAKIKHDCQIFMIDHLHFLVDMQTQQNMSLNIGAFMRQLKMIALRLHVAIILIAHQKGVAKGQDPGLEDLRDSSFIGQEADNVIIVWRQPDYSDQDLKELEKTSPVQAHAIRSKKSPFPSIDSKFADQFAVVQIAKARRSGAYRVKKLFQKVGHFMEEI